MSEKWNNGTFEQTCLRKPHERVVGKIVGANNNGIMEKWNLTQHSNIPKITLYYPE